MSASFTGRKIAVIGGGGQLGKPTVAALLSAGVHTITAVQRADSTTSFPEGVIVKKGDTDNETFLAEAFKGQDAVVLMPPLSHLVSLQKPAIRAAAKAGVPYVLPSEFGPDPFADVLVKANVLLSTKKEIRDFVDELGVSSWISVTVGPWFDASLAAGLWGIDTKSRKATIWKGAESKVSTATIKHTGDAIAAALSLPEPDLAKYKSSAVYVPSWHLTQREMLEAVQKATNTSSNDWDVTERNVEDVVKEYEAGIGKGDQMSHYTKLFVTNFMGGGSDLRNKVDAAEMKKLEARGLLKEDIQEVIKATLS